MKAYLQDNDIILRAVEPDDLDFLYLAENDTMAWSHSSTSAPMSRMLLQEYITQYTADIYRDRQLRLIAIHAHTGERIGIADLYDYDPRNSRAGIGIYTTPSLRGKGYGTAILSALCRYAQEFLNIHMLYAIIEESNAASRHIFTRCDFLHTATLVQWVKTPQGYSSAVMMQRTAQ